MATQDQHSIQDPTTQYPKATQDWKQQQEEPGLQREMTPVPDCGEKHTKETAVLQVVKRSLPAQIAGLAGRQPLPMRVKVRTLCSLSARRGSRCQGSGAID